MALSSDPFIKLPARFSMPELLIPKRTPKSHQVEIDHAHPFAQGILSCFIWDSFKPHDLANNIPSDKVTIGGSAWKIDQGFLNIDRTASNEITIADANESFELNIDTVQSWTVMHVFRFDADAVSDSDEYTLSATTLGGSSNAFIVDLGDHGMTLYDGQIHCVIYSASLGSGSNQHVLFLDGIRLGNLSVAGGNGSSHRIRYQSDINTIEAATGNGANINLLIGGTSQFGTDRWHGHLMSFTSWKRHLRQAEMELLSVDPYQFLIPAP